MQYCQNNLMRIIGNDQKNNGQNFWEILERIMGKILSIIGAGLQYNYVRRYCNWSIMLIFTYYGICCSAQVFAQC